MRKRGVYGVEVALRVPFYDLDPMQVAWHGNYAKYLEEARVALLDAIGYGYARMLASRHVWPIINFQVRYLQALTLNQPITVRAELVEWETQLVINYLIRDTDTGIRLTRATTTQVAVDTQTREMLLASPPEFVAAVVAVLP